MRGENRSLHELIFSVIGLTFIASLFSPNLVIAQANTEISPTAKAYYDRAFGIIKSGTYKKKSINFDSLYNEALITLRSAKSPADTYPVIKMTLAALKDKHSHFFYPKKQESLKSSSDFRFPLRTTCVGKDFAVLSLLSYSSTDEVQNRKVADSIYRFLLTIEHSGIKRLVIDLRNMEGGSNDPFLCGLAPLIDQKHLFSFVNTEGKTQKTVFEKGYIYHLSGPAKFGSVYLTNFKPIDNPRSWSIVVLTSKLTASAGEIIAIAFKGLKNVRFMGEATYGIPTGVARIMLADGAAIGLASSIPVDRKGHTYTSSLEPDVTIRLNDRSDDELLKEIWK